MKFPKEFLQEVASMSKGEKLDLTSVEDFANMPKEFASKVVVSIRQEISGQRRWQTEYDQIFEIDGRFFETSFERGSTENQDGSPYEYDDEMIECPEVEKYEKTVIDYRRRIDT